MNVIAGHDANDPISANLPVPDYLSALDGDVKGMRVGVVKEMMEADHLHPEVKDPGAEALRRFEGLGAIVEEVSLPMVPRWKNLMENPHQYDAASRRFNLWPGLIPGSLYQRTLQLRSLYRRQVLAACERYDILVSPSQPTPPPRIEDPKTPLTSHAQAMSDFRAFSFSNAAPIDGIPSISVPCGSTGDGLPVGLLIIAKRYDEETVFCAAYGYEQNTHWHTIRSPVGDE